MPRRWLVVSFVAMVIFVLAGLLVVAIVGQRGNQDRVYSINNIRELGQFAVLAVRPDQIDPIGPGKEAELARLKAIVAPAAIPAGTILNESLKPEDRLSWVPIALPFLNQHRQNTSDLLTKIDRSVGWNAPINQPLSHIAIRSIIPTAINAIPDENLPAPTYYLGIGGVGADAATLPSNHPRAGCFRYDQSTPFTEIGDGLRQSVLFAETATKIGPWLQGGPSTIRTFDPATPIFGSIGQFGGVHTGFSVFGYADGSAGILTDHTDKSIIYSLVTINGGKTDPLPGE